MEQSVHKIGILGGTFDPIHLGHLIIAQEALDAYSLEKVLLMPAGHSYFKDHRAQRVQPAAVRLRMTQLAAQGNPFFEVSDMEIRREGNTYTYETLDILRAAHPENAYYFITGADTIMSMRKWRRPERIFADCTILAAIREDQIPEESLEKESRALAQEMGARILPLHIPNIGISSTQIRERIAAGRSVKYLVPDAVERYIIEQRLYQNTGLPLDQEKRMQN